MNANRLILAGILFMLSLTFALAVSISSPEYFEGKWSLLIKGTPQGDASLPVRFETVGVKTTGYFLEEGAAKEKKMSSAIIKGI